jgi:general secretion pathway protein B
MSFILDALKKAEAERQRQTGPTLLEVRVTRPRRRLPVWSLVIGALLAINGVLLLLFALYRAPVATPPAAAFAPAQPTATNPPTPAATATPSAAANATATPVATPAAAAAAPTAAPMPVPAAAPNVTAVPDVAAAPEDGGSGNPADFEPAVPAGGAAGAQAQREPPNLADIGGDLPQLRLDLHVYAPQTAQRYALINMHRVREGDVLPEGPRVLAIDRDGVELSYRGTEFMLRPQ